MNNDGESSAHSVLSQQPAVEIVSKALMHEPWIQKKCPKNTLNAKQWRHRIAQAHQSISVSGLSIIHRVLAVAREHMKLSIHCFILGGGNHSDP